ncbi:hypothetical protein K7X08_028485 [Anisodus acutangulus]|uniref:Uncharacterized protein n=1 Tax=Anisodus acutangulus TaxID=402998 RepID=A0A9Q1MAD2_9SOLA|nr:hypothetical protein K7X08_028485 [Anisodus acutangulus]
MLYLETVPSNKNVCRNPVDSKGLCLSSLQPEKEGLFRDTMGELKSKDCHFLCTGKPPSSVWLRETYLKDRIDNFGRLKVDENLRVKGHRNIFVVGDITDIK